MHLRMSRRAFMRTAAEVPLLAAAASMLSDVSARPADATTRVSRVGSLPRGMTRYWLAPEYWSNRFADWRLAHGRIESLSATGGGQTVGVLTRSITRGRYAGSISVRTGTLADGTGFSGFLIGTGAGALDWRAAALVMAASGDGGGLLATYESDGQVRFREHTNESPQFTFAEFATTHRIGPAPGRSRDEDVLLRLDITPTDRHHFDLTLTARRHSDNALLSRATRAGVTDDELVGGISLISTAHAGNTNARYWFRDLATGGPKIAVAEEHATGPVIGTLYSLNGSVLKLSAQFLPIGRADPHHAVLEARDHDGSGWRRMGSTRIGAGHVALFRIPDWDGTHAWQYRVRWAAGTRQEHAYYGTIQADPARRRRLTIGALYGTIHTYRPLNKSSDGAPKLPGEAFLGLYTSANMYFPYAELLKNLSRQNPDLLFALGDQYYQDRPTRADRSHAAEDVLFRWSLWLWSFGELTRNIPTICLVDDHDVFQPNLWGWSGRRAPGGNFRYGGYTMPPTWINHVQRMQCAHNPDPYDPTPVRRGITVYYGAFTYGGVSFAVVEDRKFKNTNQFNRTTAGLRLPRPRQLLGRRQEAFLAAWKDMHPGQPKICVTGSPYACVETDPHGRAERDPDSNGGPPPARRKALRLVRDAHALMICGDQHLGSLLNQGIDTYTDGPISFTPPAAGTAFQRWFEPVTALPHSRGPHTGDYTDGFGNKFRVLAVANPKVSYAALHRAQPRDDGIGDRNLKREGYGIVHVDKTVRNYVIECWPWHTDPTAPRARQFPGWPFTVPFSRPLPRASQRLEKVGQVPPQRRAQR